MQASLPLGNKASLPLGDNKHGTILFFILFFICIYVGVQTEGEEGCRG